MQKSVFQTQFSPSKVNWIFLKMIFLFQYVIGRITFVKNFFPLLQNWKSLFTKNVPEIVWLRRSSKCKILKNHLSTKYFWVNTYLLLNVVLKIQYLWTPYFYVFGLFWFWLSVCEREIEKDKDRDRERPRFRAQ